MKKAELIKTAKPFVLKKGEVVEVVSGLRRTKRIPITNILSSSIEFLQHAWETKDDNLPSSNICPYVKGDIVYVSEPWSDASGFEYWYKADEELVGTDFKIEFEQPLRFKSPFSMPKEAARFFLKIKSVRVEKLQEITEEQIKEELAFFSPFKLTSQLSHVDVWNKKSFVKQNPECNWDMNPWVYVVEFELIEDIE